MCDRVPNDPAPSDPALIALAQQGDKAAFGQLVRRYQPMALRLALRTIDDPDLAQELVQEAMLQAYLSLGQLRDRVCPIWIFNDLS